MKYKFTYLDYSKRCAAFFKEDNFVYPLKYYAYTKGGKDFLFPKLLSPCLSFNLTLAYKKRVLKGLESKGFSNLELIALISEQEYFPVCLDNKNGNIISLNFMSEDYGVSFINSSIEQFADSLLCFQEYEKGKYNNYNNCIAEEDCITDDIVTNLFNNIRAIDLEAAKDENFWRKVVDQEIEYNEACKNGLVGTTVQDFRTEWNEKHQRYDQFNYDNEKVGYFIWNDKHKFKRWDYVVTAKI